MDQPSKVRVAAIAAAGLLVMVAIVLIAGGGSDSDEEGGSAASSEQAAAGDNEPRPAVPVPVPERERRQRPRVAEGSGDTAGRGYRRPAPVPDEPLTPTRRCEPVEEIEPSGLEVRRLGPPVPEISARRVGGHVVIRYRFLAAPRVCRPLLVIAQVRAARVGGVGPRTREVRVPRSLTGRVRVPLPRTAPPYAASVLTASKERTGSATIVLVR